MKKISIIGFGRFGQTLYRLLKDDFEVTVYNRSGNINKEILNQNTKIAKDLSEIYTSETIFFAVPIPKFESVIKEHKKYFQPHHTLIDVLSVKVYPKKIFTKYLKNISTQALLTHPMFGPDSSKNGFENLPFIIDQFKANNETYQFWKNYFENKKLQVIEMSAEEHDTLAADSQGITHFIGRILQAYGFHPTKIDSLGSKKLWEIVEQTCNDTWELFVGLQNFNPYTKNMRLKLGKVYDELYNKLLPKQVNKKFITFGIQGGKGSFNEQAIHTYIEKQNIKKFTIKYLYTSEKVLKALHAGDIDFGQFAIANSTGGLVEESLQAIANYKFKIVNEFEILIEHFLMKRNDIEKEDITTIMAHSQVLIQCQQTLAQKYGNYKLETGKGDLMDTAKAAEAVANGKLPKPTAILGPKILAKTYGFDIVDEHLQDKKDNLTRFLVVAR